MKHPYCPVHKDIIMLEELVDGHHGFCQRCLKRYALCEETKYMDLCVKLRGHEDTHLGYRGTVW